VGIRSWGLRQWGTAAVVGVLAAVVIGVPTGVVSTSLYARMTPVLWWNYPVWLASAVLMGLLAATYTGAPGGGNATRPRSARALAAGLLSVFAVGCPVCNKLVVLALGMSGAMSYWAPAQPVMAVASLALLAHALIRRLRTANACDVPPAGKSAAPAPVGASAASGAGHEAARDGAAVPRETAVGRAGGVPEPPGLGRPGTREDTAPAEGRSLR
jgi:hypothetical protein